MGYENSGAPGRSGTNELNQGVNANARGDDAPCVGVEISDRSLAVLRAVADKFDIYDELSRHEDIRLATGLPKATARQEVAALKARGMLLHTPGYTEDGKLCGSGFLLTRTGYAALVANADRAIVPEAGE